MPGSQHPEIFDQGRQVSVKLCPWCSGRLKYDAHYPVRRLIPGDLRSGSDEAVPEPLRTRPAWSCETPHCRYREPA